MEAGRIIAPHPQHAVPPTQARQPGTQARVWIGTLNAGPAEGRVNAASLVATAEGSTDETETT